MPAIPGPVWRASPDGPSSGPLQDSHVADVVVIGAGFAGLVAALELAEAGRKVVLLEAGSIGANASGASAGQIGPLFYGARKTPAQVSARLGAERGERLHRLVAASGTWLFDMIAARGIACDARRGFLCVYRSEKTLARAAEIFGQWGAYGGRSERVGADALDRSIASSLYAGGIFLPEGGFLDPVLLLEGLAAATLQARGAVHTQSRVSGLRRTGSDWEVRTDAGTVTAPQILVATGSAGLPAWPGLGRTIYPACCGIAATAPLPVRGAALLPDGGPVADMDDKAIFAPAVTADGRLLVSFLMDDPAPARRRLARAFPGRSVPAFESLSWDNVALTPDGLPRIMKGEDGLLAVTGCNGFGLTLGILAAREAVRFMLGASPDSLALPVTAPRPLPLSRAMPALFRHVLAPLANRFG